MTGAWSYWFLVCAGLIWFSYFGTCGLGSFFRSESWWGAVCLVSFLLPERGRLLHADVFLPRTQQKLLLPERASRGLWESQSLGGNKVCVLYITTFTVWVNATLSIIRFNKLGAQCRKFQFTKLYCWEAILFPFFNVATFIRNVHLWNEQQGWICGLNIRILPSFLSQTVNRAVALDSFCLSAPVGSAAALSSCLHDWCGWSQSSRPLH